MDLLPISASSSAAFASPQPMAAGGTVPFAQLLSDAVNAAESQQAVSQAGVQALLKGETNNLQAVVLDAAKADVSLQLLLGVRDRLVSAHQEIMRMQI